MLSLNYNSVVAIVAPCISKRFPIATRRRPSCCVRAIARAAESRSAPCSTFDWPADRTAGFKMLLKGGTVIPSDQQAITIIRSLPHGHVAAALGTARKIGLDRL